MSLTTLSLPVDVPWKRIAISDDMYALGINADLPVKWHSSLTVFSYDAPPDPEIDNPDEISTFLKIVASVTGYQPAGDEIDVGAVVGAFNVDVIQNYQALTEQYYPALSALIQLAVFPHDGQWDVSQYPYLTDFEPKKREVVELVSDAGEALTQSTNSLNVRKGTTSTESQEADYIDRGGAFQQGVSVAGYGGTTEGSAQKQVGTIATLGTQATNLVTTDSSREKRESYSHTTNLSQLYHVLDSYHAGTNRALFFLNSRPHFVDSPFTFVNGPRRLEGIQEFFLIVRRPKAMTQFCVKAVLETAHLHETDSTQTTGTDTYDYGTLPRTFTDQARGGGGFNAALDHAGQWTIQLPAGFKLDLTKGGGQQTIIFDGNEYVGKTADLGNVNNPTDTRTVNVPAGIAWNSQFSTDNSHWLEAIPTFSLYDDHVDITTHIYGWYTFDPTKNSDATLLLNVTVFYVSVDPVQTAKQTTVQQIDLFITARQVTSCPEQMQGNAQGGQAMAGANGMQNSGPYVVYEKSMPGAFVKSLQTARSTGRDAVIAANAISRLVKDQVVESFRPNQRYPARQVDFIHTQFAFRELLRSTDPAKDATLSTPLASHPALAPSLQRSVSAITPNLTVAQALALQPEKLAARLGTTPAEVRKMLARVIGIRKS